MFLEEKEPLSVQHWNYSKAKTVGTSKGWSRAHMGSPERADNTFNSTDIGSLVTIDHFRFIIKLLIHCPREGRRERSEPSQRM